MKVWSWRARFSLECPIQASSAPSDSGSSGRVRWWSARLTRKDIGNKWHINSVPFPLEYKFHNDMDEWRNSRKKQVNGSYKAEKAEHGSGRGSWLPEAGMLGTKRGWVYNNVVFWAASGPEQAFFPRVLMVQLFLLYGACVSGQGPVFFMYVCSHSTSPPLFFWAWVSAYFSTYPEETDWQRFVVETMVGGNPTLGSCGHPIWELAKGSPPKHERIQGPYIFDTFLFQNNFKLTEKLRV